MIDIVGWVEWAVALATLGRLGGGPPRVGGEVGRVVVRLLGRPFSGRNVAVAGTPSVEPATAHDEHDEGDGNDDAAPWAVPAVGEDDDEERGQQKSSETGRYPRQGHRPHSRSPR